MFYCFQDTAKVVLDLDFFSKQYNWFYEKNIFILLSAIVFALLLSCKKSPGGDIIPESDAPGVITPVGISDGMPVSKTISSAGGSLMSADGKIECATGKRKTAGKAKRKNATQSI